MVLPEGSYLEIISLRVADITLSHVREAPGAALWGCGIIQPGEERVEWHFNNHLPGKTKHSLSALCDVKSVGVEKNCRLGDPSLSYLSSPGKKFLRVREKEM